MMEYRFLFMGAALGDIARSRVMSEWAEDGWRFTGYAEGAPSGTNYVMERDKRYSDD